MNRNKRNEENLITVILPIYNVEKYLRRAVDSIRKQTYKNLEIILVDDGSSDGCKDICDELALEDKRIKTIHKKNGGVSDARNCGLANATGDYITFVDPDDWIYPCMYEHMMNAMKENQAEIVMCSYQIEEDGKESYIGKCNLEENEKFVLLSREQGQQIYFSGTKKATEGCVLWNKIVKADLYSGISFPLNRIQEDESITFKLMYRAKKIVYTKTPYYVYTVRKDGYMNGGFKESRFGLFLAYQERIEFYKKQKEFEFLKSQILLYLHMMAQYYFWTKRAKKFNSFMNQYRRNWIFYYKQNRKNISLSKREKLECEMFCYFPILYYYLWRQFRNSK